MGSLEVRLKLNAKQNLSAFSHMDWDGAHLDHSGESMHLTNAFFTGEPGQKCKRIWSEGRKLQKGEQ